MLNIQCIETGPIATNCYVIYEDTTNTAFVIDCTVEGYDDIKNFLDTNNLKLQFILLTHTHWDHCGDAYKFKESYNIDIFCHKHDEYRLIEPKENSVYDLPYELKGIKADGFLNEGDIIEFEGHKFTVLHTPGHTEGSITIFNKDEKISFVGDLLFKESIGRTDLPGGDFKEIINSLKKITTSFDKKTKIYSGHGPDTTIAYELANNPFIINYLDEF